MKKMKIKEEDGEGKRKGQMEQTKRRRKIDVRK